MKTFNRVILMAAAIVAAGCADSGKKTEGEQTVRVEMVESAAAESDMEYPGRVKAADDVSLAFRVSGTIKRFCVDEGSTVRKGQLLAELDPTDYQAQLDATEAEYHRVKAEADRVVELYKEKVSTPNDNDKAIYGLKQMEAKLKHHRDQLAYTRLYAPFDGTVQKQLFESHETVGAGMPVISIIGNGGREVEISLPASDYVGRKNFTAYSCTFSVFPDKVYRLEPVSISPKANANQLYTMRLSIIADGKSLPSPGMNTMVKIARGEDAAADIVVPGAAVLEDGGKSYVFVYQPTDKTVRRREVNIVRLLGNGRCVVTGDVKNGMRVVSAGVHHIKDGESVRLLPETTSTNVGGLL